MNVQLGLPRRNPGFDQAETWLKAIDEILVTHMHGDYVTDVPHVREKMGAIIWTHDPVAKKFNHPLCFPYGGTTVRFEKMYFSSEYTGRR